MICKSEVLTQASGSVGGTVYGRNHGRITRRARTVPTDPQSPNQRAQRALVATLASAWTNDATDANRKSWSAYALGLPIPDKLGDEQLVSGRVMFMRCNAPRLLAGLEPVLPGPAINGSVQLSFVPFLSLAGAPELQWFLPVADAWAQEPGGGLNLQTSRYLSPAINFFNGPWRHLISILGGPGGPPALLLRNRNAFQQRNVRTSFGQRIAVRYVAFRADGRISPERIILQTLT